jgi:carbon monoxide dehydrogenase subunit G
MLLSFHIKKPADLVFDYLTDMQKFVSVHPVIHKIIPTGEETYLIHETLRFGPVPFTFKYPCSIEKNPVDRTVVMRATVMKLTRIDITFILKERDDATLINETVHFHTVMPLKFFMKNIFRKQHTRLFRNIENVSAENE